jgi:hypothetical protein
MKFSILGEGAEIIVDVLNRKYPEFDDYWDGNWLNSTINIIIPGYRVLFPADIRADDIHRFYNQLKELNKSLKGTAVFENIEGIIELKAAINKLGRIEWQGKTTFPVGTGATLEFQFRSNQSYLPSLISQIEKIAICYPVLGDFQDMY